MSEPRNSNTPRRRHARRNDIVVGEENSRTLITRRRFLYGAAGVGAVAIVGTGAYLASNANRGSDEVDYLKVPEDAVTTQLDMEAEENYENRLQLVATHDIPYGTLVWALADDVAGCLVPTETGSPLSQLALLALGSGTLETLLDKAVGAEKGFEIYDMRADASSVIWTEANVLEGVWRIYTAKISNFTMGEPALVDEGDETYDTPSLALSGGYAFWQVLPKLPNDDGLPSVLKRATPGRKDAEVVYESARRMACAPYSNPDTVTIAPRLDMSTVYYQFMNINAKTGEVTETLTLPSGMKPLDVAYGKNGFMWTFDSIYNYGDGIANLGTYSPMKPVTGGDYSASKWFSFARTPYEAPAWAGNVLVVKSTYSVCGVDMDDGVYTVIDVDDGADDYGEYLASTGMHDTFVTFTNIDHTPVDAAPVKACRVKVWQPIPASQIVRPEKDDEQGSESAQAVTA